MNINKLREKHKLTQSDLSDKIGVSQSAVAKWETGETIPSTKNLIKLAQIFNCTIDELVR